MKKVLFTLLVSTFLLFAHEGFSQTSSSSPSLPPGDGDPDCPFGDCPDNSPGAPNAIPIDGGLSWLLAAGGIYGVSKLRKNFKK